MSDFVVGINPVRETLLHSSRQLLELWIAKEKPNERLNEIVTLAEQKNLPVLQVERRDLQRLAGPASHQGVLLKVAAYLYSDFDEVVSRWRASGDSAFFLLLDGITDPHNFGAILRSAEQAGCQAVIVPRDRSCPVTAVVEKTAAGALSHISLCQVVNLSRAIDELKKNGIWCYGLAGDAGASDLFLSDLRGNIGLVVGSEGRGIRPNVRSHCDGLLAIPMQGHLESLNASVAVGIALFEVLRQNR
jgi:23S rRNA (guanosine2251-2'-O)-methyltransferase